MKSEFEDKSKPLSWVKSLAKDMSQTVKSISDEYYQLPKRPEASEAEFFFKNQAARRNRYRDIPCLDKTRVVLKDAPNGNNYIHANWVDMPQSKCRYIMTQAPLPETTVDFWSLVWQEDIVFIICLTKILEQGKVKTLEYWPTCCGKEFYQKHGSIHIRNVGVKNADHYSLTMLEVANEKTKERRKLLHLLYLDWPDHRVPTCTHNFLQLIDFLDTEVRNWKRDDEMIVMVHCSAGVGRSGTLVALHYLVNEVKQGRVPRVANAVANVRLQRAMSVQAPEQYVFIYWALCLYTLSTVNLSRETKTEILRALVLLKSNSTKSTCSLSPPAELNTCLPSERREVAKERSSTATKKTKKTRLGGSLNTRRRKSRM